MPGRKIILAFCLICLVASSSRAQQPVPSRPKPASNGSRTSQQVPPPPKPAEDSPSLEVTMKYIEAKLNSANITSVVTYLLATYVIRVRITGATANPKDCKLSWHTVESRDSVPDHTPIAPRTTEGDWQLSLADAREVTVQTESDHQRQLVPEEEMELRPVYYHLAIKMQPEKRALRHVGGREGRDWAMPTADVELPDEDSANRLAKAIVHAIELCGGGDNDPFK